jgi:C-terminal processing protease CtpA/Prc
VVSGTAVRGDAAQHWANDAFDVIEEHAYFAGQMDFGAWRARIAEAATGQRPADLSYLPIAALSDLRDRHSRFLNPDQAAALQAELSGTGTAPAVSIEVTIDNGIGYLELPSILAFLGSDRGYDFAASGARALVSGGACGWIIDLRDNQGGSIDPMLAGIAPLLGPGEHLSYADRDGKLDIHRIDEQLAVSSVDTKPRPIPGLDNGTNVSDLAVALIVGPKTASSGEGVVIAFAGRRDTRTFGMATYGVPTGNELFSLSDGSALVLTTSVGRDRTGHLYTGKIEPDELVRTLPPYGPGDDVVVVARTWLAEQPSCR